MPGLGPTCQQLSAPLSLGPSPPFGIMWGQFLFWNQTLWMGLDSNIALHSLPLLGAVFLVRGTNEGEKVQEAHQTAHDPQILFLHPNLESRARLMSKAEAGCLIIVQLEVSRQRL